MGKLITVRRMSLLKVTVPHPMFRMWSRFVVIRRHLPPPPVAVPQTHPRAPHADHAQNCIRYRTAATPPPSAPCHSRAAALRGGASGAASAPAAAATLLLRALHPARSGLHPASAERIRSRSGDLSKAQDAHRARGAVAAHRIARPGSLSAASCSGSRSRHAHRPVRHAQSQHSALVRGLWRRLSTRAAIAGDVRRLLGAKQLCHHSCARQQHDVGRPATFPGRSDYIFGRSWPVGTLREQRAHCAASACRIDQIRGGSD